MKTRGFCLAALCAALLALALGAAPAQANRALLSEEALHTSPGPPAMPPPEAQIEGACGLAVSPGGSLYVSDYYHRVVDVFSSGGTYQSQISLPGTNPTFGTNTLDAVCGLAFDSTGRLYANEWHEGVLRLQPTEASLDSEESTGVAVDSAGDVYVDDRTYVAVYDSSGSPLPSPSSPLKIGFGSLTDAYGLAVSRFSGTAGRIYVPDAGNDTVKAFDSAGTSLGAIAPPGGFHSLVDAAVAVDPINGHLLVVDNTQPGFEHPKAAVYEFDSSGAFLGTLRGSPVDGEPSGIAVAADGTLYVTDGNGEESNVFDYGPYTPPPPGGATPLGAASSQPLSAEQSTPAVDSGGGQPALAAGGQSPSANPHRARSRSHNRHRRNRHRGTKRGRGRR
jgi:hypothetical protein